MFYPGTDRVIESFSGTHPYDSSVFEFLPTYYLPELAEEWGVDASEIAGWRQSAINRADHLIAQSICPRCEGKLLTNDHPQFYPAGSRITQCRSVPVCSDCGTHEAFEVAILGECSRLEEWAYLLRSEILSSLERIQAKAKPGYITVDKVMTADGVGELDTSPTTGGWAQFGTRSE